MSFNSKDNSHRTVHRNSHELDKKRREWSRDAMPKDPAKEARSISMAYFPKRRKKDDKTKEIQNETV